MIKPNYGFTDANVLKPKTDDNTPMEDIALLVNRAKQIGCNHNHTVKKDIFKEQGQEVDYTIYCAECNIKIYTWAYGQTIYYIEQ